MGCYGPAADVIDQGARMLSAVSSVVNGKTHAEIGQVLEGIVDPAGTFYRFSMASSLLHRAKDASKRRE
jgi:F420-non-reducing hydrogenase small subunit